MVLLAKSTRIVMTKNIAKKDGVFPKKLLVSNVGMG